MGDYTISKAHDFIAVDVFDDDPDRVEYEVWKGNNETGNWHPITYRKTYEQAVRAAKAEAKRRNWR